MRVQNTISKSSTPLTEIFSSIQGEGMLAGYRQIFIRFPVCNLSCQYCDTILIAGDHCMVHGADPNDPMKEIAQPITGTQVLDYIHEQCRRFPGLHHSISITGGEPLLHDEILADWLPEFNILLPIHLETNGTCPDALGRLIQHIDYISMDIKLPSVTATSPQWDLHQAFLSVAVERDLSVKLVTSETTSDSDLKRAAQIVAECDPEIPCFLQPVTASDGTVAVSAATLFRQQALLARQLDDVRIIPQFHRFMGVL